MVKHSGALQRGQGSPPHSGFYPDILNPNPLLRAPQHGVYFLLHHRPARVSEVRPRQPTVRGTADGDPQGQAGEGEEVPQHPWSFSCPLPCPKPPSAPSPWGVTTEAVSFSSCPATLPTSATLQGLEDPELNSGQDCATSVLRERWSELQHMNWGRGDTYVPTHNTRDIWSGRWTLNTFSVQFGSGAQSCQTLCNPWPAACQASLSITNSQSLLKLMSIELVMLSSHLILCFPLLLPPSIFPSIRVFSNESVLHIRWPKCWSFSLSIRPSNEYSGLISFRMDL